MAQHTIIVLCLSVALCLGTPSDEVLQVPQNTQVQGQVNVKPPLVYTPQTQVTVEDKGQNKQEGQEQELQPILPAVLREGVIPDNIELERQDPALVGVPVAPVPNQVSGGESAPDLLEDGELSNVDKSDLETANSWGWGWRRRGWGWGGGWGGYYRPSWGYYRGRGWGHGWGRGYGYWG